MNIIGIALTVILGLVVCRIGLFTWKGVIISGIVGLIIWAIIDFIFGYQLGMWNYYHHKWWSSSYFFGLYPGFIRCGISTWFIWLLSKDRRYAFVLCVLLVGVFEESMGYLRHSWSYDCSILLVSFGWLGYVGLSIMAVNLLLSVNRIEAQHEDNEAS